MSITTKVDTTLCDKIFQWLAACLLGPGDIIDELYGTPLTPLSLPSVRDHMLWLDEGRGTVFKATFNKPQIQCIRNWR
jgi:hypothetical protein